MSSGFITESEVADARQRRQEEWEKVRSAEQPLERPEEPYDGRSLYDRLKEQKAKKDMEYEEAHKLKNLIRGLDDDEVQFLEQVDERKIAAEQRQMQEDEKELEEFRNRVATLQEQNVDKIIQAEVKTQTNFNKPKVTNRPSQKDLLGIGIKRKSVHDPNEVVDVRHMKEAKKHSTSIDKGLLKCIKILPGIGSYNESSDSEISTGSEDEPLDNGGCHYDLVGRKLNKKKECAGE